VAVENKARLDEVFIEMGGKLCDLIGWRRVVGQVYVLLYIADKPLSLDDIARRINMSKSTVWGVIKRLERLCAVNRAGIKEGKRDSYTAERDLNVILKNGIIPELSSRLLFAGGYLEQVEKALIDFQQGEDSIQKEQWSKYHALIKEINMQKAAVNGLIGRLNKLLDSGNFQMSESKTNQISPECP
jgi:DNA-binding transcriptional regulator GbsR (MarR family)